MRRKMIAGNWKMNGSSSFARDYLCTFKSVLADAKLSEGLQVVLAPPAILLTEMKSALTGTSITLAGQSVSSYESGAYTGELSSAMLSDAGCSWCLVGHSERRALFGESDSEVVKKVKQLLRQKIRPILCVGETLEQRENGIAEDVVAKQLNAVLDVCSDEALALLVVAYEPVWAIGTGKTATPDQAQAMHKSIRSQVAKKSASLANDLSILYGGSVNASNARELFSQNDIDGGLVGGASLKAEQFSQICEQMG